MSTVTLTIEGKSYELPTVEGTEKEKAIDIAKLRDLTGYVTLDTGYKNTGATKSTITFLDGENGILHYRGYPIEQLADKSNFVEVAYLLIYGALPTQAEYNRFVGMLAEETKLHDDVKKILDGFPKTAHPMGVLTAVISALTAFDPDSLNPHRPWAEVERTIVRLIAQMPVLIAWIYKKSIGEAYPNPKWDKGYVEDYSSYMFGSASGGYTINPVIIGALHKLLILHADHEQNCSTSTVRIVGSSDASLYSSIAAGVCALWGPLHGGANQEVLEMLEEIRKDGGDTKKYLDKARDKNDPFRLMGFGHRVYKNFDPRARIIKVACDEVLTELGVKDPILEIAKQLEQAALSDEYFVQRKLYPNVDFYSGIIYRALGIPVEFFTVMFAFGRLPGWISQWKELKDNKEPIGRPRQIYTGATNRDYVEISKR